MMHGAAGQTAGPRAQPRLPGVLLPACGTYEAPAGGRDHGQAGPHSCLESVCPWKLETGTAMSGIACQAGLRARSDWRDYDWGFVDETDCTTPSQRSLYFPNADAPAIHTTSGYLETHSPTE
eukprot:CAMPEP_0117690262 /NCGR_PEP_ID=MMETSP0804-20121206/25026_1 /TAXON_ID=1074897 /ORGANISM="Tetraselmis astigmatica, Strain CCMP880" /LENGTH=121 /DNA_ID=CAMNT_0005503283 /DNA_START=138 /DNA_END=503 /DNA_ORIENTATION=-